MAANVVEVAEVDELYGLPLDEFVPARDALAKRLRAAKERDAANQVKSLAKPSRVAWAINQVAREQPDEVAALLEAGVAVRKSQDAALQRGDAKALRDATVARRSALKALLAPAVALAGSTHADEVRTTLEEASLDDDAAEALRHGRLTTTLAPVAGFGFGFDVEPEQAGDAAPAPPPRSEPVAGGRGAKRAPASPGPTAQVEAADEAPAGDAHPDGAQAGGTPRRKRRSAASTDPPPGDAGPDGVDPAPDSTTGGHTRSSETSEAARALAEPPLDRPHEPEAAPAPAPQAPTKHPSRALSLVPDEGGSEEGRAEPEQGRATAAVAGQDEALAAAERQLEQAAAEVAAATAALTAAAEALQTASAGVAAAREALTRPPPD